MLARPLTLFAATASLAAGPVAADPPVYQQSATQQITYPVPPFSRWTIIHLPTGAVYARDRIWPRSDLGPIQGANPDYAWLLQGRTEPPDYDRRLRGYQCAPEAILLDPVPAPGEAQTGTATVHCTAPILPPPALKAAVSVIAAERADEAVQAAGIRSPTDILLATAALERRSRGVPLSDREAALLSGVTDAVREYVGQIEAAEAAIHAWIDAHPGELPDVSDAAWPPLPAGPAAPAGE